MLRDVTFYNKDNIYIETGAVKINIVNRGLLTRKSPLPKVDILLLQENNIFCRNSM